jgi:hypothetical protein
MMLRFASALSFMVCLLLPPQRGSLVAQSGSEMPHALQQLAEAERAFVRRAQEVAAAQAFSEFFAADAVSIRETGPLSAQDDLRDRPRPARNPDALFWWEPRYGDVAASGELGWLTGPVQSTRDRAREPIRHGNYASIWKRQADGQFKIVMDIGIDTPGEVRFPPGFTAADVRQRYSTPQIGPLAMSSLLAADQRLMRVARSSVADAYRPVLTSSSRLHRSGHLPWLGADAVLAWLRTRPHLETGETMYVETAKSADFGYTWGSFTEASVAGSTQGNGYYARVWTRDRGGDWKLALDVAHVFPPK